MKRSRAKAIGLGLALLASDLRASEPDWRPASQPGTTAAPSLLPRDVRPAERGAAASSDAPIVWLPARTAPPQSTHASGTPAFAPSVVPTTATPSLNAIGPVMPTRPATIEREVVEAPRISEPSPVSLVAPGQSPPEVKEWRPISPTSPTRFQPPAPAPRVVGEPRPEKLPEKLPEPKPMPTTQPALPTIPAVPTSPPVVQHPVVQHPVGPEVPGKHGSFGSVPVNISRDCPSLSQLCPDLFDRERFDGHRLAALRDRAGADGGSGLDRFQFQAEYLLWWVRPARIPALATTTIAPGADPSSPLGNGFLGDPTTRLLFGPGTFGGNERHGLRVRAGAWFGECGDCGIDASYFFLGRKTDTFSFSSPGLPVITRPFFSPNIDPTTGAVIGETGEIVAFPNFSAGTLTAQTTSFLWGADVNLRKAWCRRCDFQGWCFAGYRFLSLHESLRINEFITALPGNPADPPGTMVVVQDQFDTRNRFHGGQLGVAAERSWGRLSLSGRASVALGNTHQILTIDGAQLRAMPGATPEVFRGGLLAAGPNLGQFTSDRFSVVPEATINLGLWVTPSFKTYLGYNFLYWTNVIRPGDQIDRVVDVTFVPNAPPGIAPSGLNRPQPLFRQSDLWVQGVQFGVEWQW